MSPVLCGVFQWESMADGIMAFVQYTNSVLECEQQPMVEANKQLCSHLPQTELLQLEEVLLSCCFSEICTFCALATRPYNIVLQFTFC